MPRAASTLDSFAAIAEPRRREMLGVMARLGGEMQVNDLVAHLGWPQPQVSKHLAVLRQVGLVSVRPEGQKRMYRMNAEELKPVHEWVGGFEKFWTHQMGRIKQRAERAAREHERAKHKNNSHPRER